MAEPGFSVVAGSKPWNRRVFEEVIAGYPGEWAFAATRAELDEVVAGRVPRRIFFLHWSWIVPDRLLAAAECVCFHMTDVPYGRGGSPLQNLVVRGHDRTKLTALRMTATLDEGPVYAKRDLDLHGTAEEVYVRATYLAASMIRTIVDTDPEPVAQEGEVVEFARRKPPESELPDDLTLPALHDFIRMLDAQGYPHAFLRAHGLRLEFRRAALYDGRVEADVVITRDDAAMTTLVVAAHPDDEVLGCGGTIARLTAAGEDVHIVILGEGVTSRFTERAAADPSDLDRLAGDSRQAAAILGAASVALCGLPDNRFDTAALLDIVKLVEAAIDRVSPTVVYSQHGGDLNVDHQLTFRAVLAATRPIPGNLVREVLAFEVGSSTEWAFQRFAPAFRPSVFVDVSDTIDRKVDALNAYAGETRPFPHPRSPESIRAQAARWGSTAGVMAAEAFELIRMVR